MTGRTRWLFGDQLGDHFTADHEGRFLLVESRAVFERRRFHRQKAHLVLSAMRHRAAELDGRATYLRTSTYRAALAGVEGPLEVVQPTSRAAVDLVRSLGETREVVRLPARGFVTDRDQFNRWAEGRGNRRLLLEDFYRDVRRRTGVLMEADGEPCGGRWNFDAAEHGSRPRRARAPWGSPTRGGRRRTRSMPASARTSTPGRPTGWPSWVRTDPAGSP